MPYRKTLLVNNEVYHVVARGIARAPIFSEKKDYQRIIEVISFYQYANPPLSFSHYKRLPCEEKEKFINNLRKHKKIIEIFAFCLMPNHCHFLLRQIQDMGISTFMRNFLDSYARYFNTKYKRSGGLFQSMFKAVRIETDEQLLHVSRYIHLNPSSAYLVKIEELENYPWSSFPEYLSSSPRGITNPKFILNFFKTGNDYKEFVLDQADYQRKLQRIKHLTLEG